MMKEYIKPEAELMKYLFDSTIADGSKELPTDNDEFLIPDIGGGDENLDDF